MNKKSSKIIILLILVIIPLILNIYNFKTDNFENDESYEKIFKLHSSSSNFSNIIVFFNQSTFDQNLKNRFKFYGGRIKNQSEWINTFNSVSGFAGSIPNANISLFSEESPEINIEIDEIIQTYLNYATLQSRAINSTWFTNGFTGDTDSSVAVLDSGIDLNQEFLQGKVVGWENFVDNNPISDEYGHGTFISSIISGTGTRSPNSLVPSEIIINNSYSHTDLFDEYLPSKNYSFKIISFNASELNSRIRLDSSWRLIESGIDDVFFELYFNSELVNYSHNALSDVSYNINHKITQDGQGIYDIYMKYHKQLNKVPKFSFNLSVSLFPESYFQDVNHFTGIANGSKLVSFKVVNDTGIGYTSDLISSMASVIKNKTTYQIVSACLSIGTLGNDVVAINKVINDVADNGIIVVIAAGNNGIEGSNPLNKLALSQNSIVVGAINDKDQITSYSSSGYALENNLIKPDIVAPGGSLLAGHRTIMGAKDNSDKATTMTGTSISAAIVSGAINILIDSKWDNWTVWNSQNTPIFARYLKSILLMTASETNLEREDNPSTEIDESSYSPSTYVGTSPSLKDIHEGYGRINVDAAIDAITRYLFVNQSVQNSLASSNINPLGRHAFARRVKLDPNKQYSFQLKVLEENSELEMFLYSNNSKRNGEPILYESTRKWYGDSDSFYFTPKNNQTDCIIVIKAYEGKSDFIVNFTNVQNKYPPQLKIPNITYVGGEKNTTILSNQESLGFNPSKNYSIDTYRFYIDYYDFDPSNVPPQEIQVHVVETLQNFTLSQTNPLNNNYTEGALFWSAFIQFPIPGIYNYYFTASDGQNLIKFPISSYFNISIEFPTDSEQIPYSYDFKSGWQNWTHTGTGWNMLNQSNVLDDRSLLYDDEWQAIYYGREHTYPTNYTYQPYIITEPYLNGSLISPLFNLTEVNQKVTHPFLKFGIRISINDGDNIHLQINLNWTGWTTLKTYSNEERDWFMEEINMTNYIGNFLQFRFLSDVDDQFDSVNHKGLILDHFAIYNHSNYFNPLVIFNESIDLSNHRISLFDKLTISCRYFDDDNNYPDYVYLEIDGNNYTMINPIGDWDINQSLREGNGILFIKSIVISEFSDLVIRFHSSDGRYMSSSAFYNLEETLLITEEPDAIPYNVIKEGKVIGRLFSEEYLDEFYIAGKPLPKESTLWLMGDNSWHSVRRGNQAFIYGGQGQAYGGLEQGYGEDWEIKLISKPIQLLGEYDPILSYYFEISLQNEFGLETDELDRCSVHISTDFGNTWILLKEYLYNDDKLSGNETINLSFYSERTVMIMFVLDTNQNNIGLGFGWLLSEIFIGYNQDSDFIFPVITSISLTQNQIIKSIYSVQFNISDNRELDLDKIYLYIDNQLQSRNSFSYDMESKILKYNWDTTKFIDGPHTIRVIAYDNEGNKAEIEINVYVQNGLFNLNNFFFWIIMLIGISLISSILIYIIIRRKREFGFTNHRKVNAEEVRLRYIDKEQIIKRIELLESAEELNRPLTLYCRYCKSWFQTPKFNYICPNCEHDQIYVAYNCLNCGKWYFKNEPAEDYYCSNNNCDGVRLIRREISEVKKILAEDRKVLKPYKKKSNKFSVLD